MKDPMQGPTTGQAANGPDEIHRIQEMKAELQAHYERFKALRAAGRDDEALVQFNVTLRAAGHLMETSTRVLKDLAARAAIQAQAPDTPGVYGRVLHLPGSHRTH